jgi:(E)-4-hydroxy-3-methylbut-2-enyl-diphosphate synthase
MPDAEVHFLRRTTRPVRVGRVTLGSGYPVAVQSMTTTPTADVDATVAQIRRLADAGADLVRLAVPTLADAEALGRIRRQVDTPLVADIHFNARLALATLAQGVDKIRINPGNVPADDDLFRVIDEARARGAAIRLGVNSGSIMPRRKNPAPAGEGGPASGPGEGLTPETAPSQHSPQEIADRMVREILRYLDLFQSRGFRDLVLSLKASDVPTTIAAYRAAAAACDCPLHLGVTAAGPREEAVLKSALGIGSLLAEGLGDTIRVSITGDPQIEVQTAVRMLEIMHLRPLGGVEVLSCPTCGRCQVDLAPLAERLYLATRAIRRPLRVAVMGCVVNGPGEAREADLGLAAGKGFGVLFRHGRPSGEKIPEDQLFDRLMAEILRL